MAENIERLTTALADRYAIERELGEGGMATVYLAHDRKHNRPVAVKVLRPELAAILGAERFLKEIEVTANLQHPNILQLYDSGTAGQPDGGTEFLYYVMPYVEGETLREKLDLEKQLRVNDAIEIAKGVAAALDYAHRQDVIHRDIKPENIMLLDGQPLVADFGIALAVSQAGGTRLTETGLSIGTPHYMSPEQAAADRKLDGRSDVYSLGAMVYEMLVGQPPFVAASVQAVMSKILTEPPTPVTDERPAVPDHVNAAVLTALTKLPADRFTTAAQFTDALSDPTFATRAATRSASSRIGPWKRIAVAASAVAVGLAFALLWALTRAPPAPVPVIRYTISFPDSQRLLTTAGSSAALSPDGSRLVYVGPAPAGQTQLWVRERDGLESVPIPHTEAAWQPFFGPDNDRVAFLTSNRDVRIVPFTGVPPVIVVDSVYRSWGGAWAHGFVYASSWNVLHRGVIRAPDTGGPMEVVTTVDTAVGESTHLLPDVLPNGRGMVFTVRRGADVSDDSIAVHAFGEDTHQALVPGSIGRYARTGHLVVVQSDGALLAIPFDQDKLQVVGPAVPLYSGIERSPAFALSRAGRLAYPRAGSVGELEIVWLDRQGSISQFGSGLTIARPNQGGGPVLSPDGRQFVINVARDERDLRFSDVWIGSTTSNVFTRLTFRGGLRPKWAANGRTVLFLRDRTSNTDSVFAIRADGVGGETPFRVPLPGNVIDEFDWTDSLERLLFRTRDGNIWSLGPAPDSIAVRHTDPQASPAALALSPDGRWLAYASFEEGEINVFVEPFPQTGAGTRWQVSTNGGGQPAWAHSGRELFYFDRADRMVAVSVETQPTFEITGQTILFTAPSGSTPQYSAMRRYDVSADDQRFLMYRNPVGYRGGELTIVENFFEELKEKVGN